MDYRNAALFVVISSCSLAQTPATCVRQPVPLKPALVLCSNAAPVCAVDQNEPNGNWVWVCPVQPVRINSSNPVSFTQPPHIVTQVVIAPDAQKLRVPQETLPPADSALLPSNNVPPPDETDWRIMTPFEKSMKLWHTIKPTTKIEEETLKAMDRFYADPANLKVPIAEALIRVTSGK